MAMSIMRFNLVLPGLDPQLLSNMHKAALDMIEYADQHGFAMVTLEEHHGAENGWSPSPLVFAGLAFGRTKQIGVTRTVVPRNSNGSPVHASSKAWTASSMSRPRPVQSFPWAAYSDGR